MSNKEKEKKNFHDDWKWGKGLISLIWGKKASEGWRQVPFRKVGGEKGKEKTRSSSKGDYFCKEEGRRRSFGCEEETNLPYLWEVHRADSRKGSFFA